MLYLGIACALLALVCLFMAFRMMERTTELNRLQDAAAAAQREAKKLQSQLDSQSQKYQQKAQEASQKGTKAKSQKARIADMQNDLQSARSELDKAKGKVKSMSSDLNRLRIEREELREGLKSKKEAHETKASRKRTSEPEAPKESPAEGAGAAPGERAEAAEESGRQKSLGRLERDLERVTEDRDKLKDRFVETRKKLVRATSELRAARRKSEHNRRAWIITQLQLDLLSDANYLLEHGEPPPYPMAEKSKKRKQLEPQGPEAVVVDRDAEVIDRTEVPVEQDEDGMIESAAIIERAPKPDAAEGGLEGDDGDSEPEPESEPDEALESLEPEELEAIAEMEEEQDGPPPTPEDEKAQAEETKAEAPPEPAPKKTTRLRKTAKAAGDDQTPDAGAAPIAPPRPE